MKDNKLKEYIGDGVHIDFDGENVVLSTNNGIKDTNRIYLEPDNMEKLIKYCNKIQDIIRN